MIVQSVQPSVYFLLNFIFVGGKWVANLLNFAKQCRETSYLRDSAHTVSTWSQNGNMSTG